MSVPVTNARGDQFETFLNGFGVSFRFNFGGHVCYACGVLSKSDVFVAPNIDGLISKLFQDLQRNKGKYDRTYVSAVFSVIDYFIANKPVSEQVFTSAETIAARKVEYLGTVSSSSESKKSISANAKQKAAKSPLKLRAVRGTLYDDIVLRTNDKYPAVYKLSETVVIDGKVFDTALIFHYYSKMPKDVKAQARFKKMLCCLMASNFDKRKCYALQECDYTDKIVKDECTAVPYHFVSYAGFELRCSGYD